MQFPDFDSVMQLYMTSKRGQKSEAVVHHGRQLSATTGHGGGQGCGGAGRGGRGRGDPDAQQKGLVSQADIDKVTTIENKHYPKEVYAKFSAAEKAKHWQLRNPEKERGNWFCRWQEDWNQCDQHFRICFCHFLRRIGYFCAF
jgi:hypothetical protein